MSYGCIYLARNIQNNKIYIGYATKFTKRKGQHISSAFNLNAEDYNTHFHNAIRTQGIQNFTWRILGYCETRDELLESEIESIFFYRAYGSDGIHYDKVYGYNSTLGGDGVSKGTVPWIKGKHHTQQSREKQRQSHLGKKQSEETKRKNSLAKKGKKFTEEHKQNMRKPKSEEFKQNLRKPRPEEVKQKIKETKQKSRPANAKDYITIEIILKLQREKKTLDQIAKELNCGRQTICNRIKEYKKIFTF